MLRTPPKKRPLRLGLIASYNSILLLGLAKVFRDGQLPNVTPVCGIITSKASPTAEVGMNEILPESDRRVFIPREDCSTDLQFNRNLIHYNRANPVDLIVRLDD
jgi:hypothetical protein